MAEVGANSVAGNIATIKTELIHRNNFKTRNEARLSVFRYIEGFYNPVRRHSALGYKSPADYERIFKEDREAPTVVGASS